MNKRKQSRVMLLFLVTMILLPMGAIKADATRPDQKIINEAKSCRDQLARVAMSEANTEPLIGKVAVVTTILNRAEQWDIPISEVLADKTGYSRYNNGKPTDECYLAVDMALRERDLFPRNMVYFRTDYYHKKYGIPYTRIGSHFFSLDDE